MHNNDDKYRYEDNAKWIYLMAGLAMGLSASALIVAILTGKY